MAEKRKKNSRKAYLNDIRLNESGKYAYQGYYYCFTGDEAERKKAYRALWLLLMANIAVAVASGCLSGAGITNTFYVIIPYIGEMSAIFALAWNHVKLLTKGEEIREYIYRSAHDKMPVAAMLTAFFAIVGAVLSLVFSVSTGFRDGVGNAVAYLLLKVASATVALIYRNYFSKLEWIKV